MTEAGTGPIEADREPGDAELREALEILDGLRYIESEPIDTGAGEYAQTGRDRLDAILDTTDDAEAIVDEHGDELAGLTEIDDRQQLVWWVELVRPAVLERLAYELNHAADHMGSSTNYIVVGGTVVSEGGRFHRYLAAEAAFASRRSRPAAIARPLVLIRSRGRRSRRVTSRRRTPARSRKPDPPARPLRAAIGRRAAA